MTARGTAIQNVAFFLFVALTTLAFLTLIGDFLMPVFWAAVLATVFFPLQRRYVAGLGGRRSLAALATILTITGLVVVPLFLVGLAMSQEAVQLHEQIIAAFFVVVWEMFAQEHAEQTATPDAYATFPSRLRHPPRSASIWTPRYTRPQDIEGP